jgi:hypothetical protein
MNCLKKIQHCGVSFFSTLSLTSEMLTICSFLFTEELDNLARQAGATPEP